MNYIPLTPYFDFAQRKASKGGISKDYNALFSIIAA